MAFKIFNNTDKEITLKLKRDLELTVQPQSHAFAKVPVLTSEMIVMKRQGFIDYIFISNNILASMEQAEKAAEVTTNKGVTSIEGALEAMGVTTIVPTETLLKELEERVEKYEKAAEKEGIDIDAVVKNILDKEKLQDEQVLGTTFTSPEDAKEDQDAAVLENLRKIATDTDCEKGLCEKPEDCTCGKFIQKQAEEAKTPEPEVKAEPKKKAAKKTSTKKKKAE